MAELWNIKEGRTERVPDEEALAKYKSGNYSLPARLVEDGQVGVRMAGESYNIPVSQVLRALSEGYTLQTGEQKAQQAEVSRAEAISGALDTVAPAVAAASGFASGATLGGSDVITRGLVGGAAARGVGQFQAEHPIATAVGTAASLFMPTGAAGLAASAGKAAQSAKALQGTSKLAKLGRLSAFGAAEGAVLGTGQAVSEYTLGREPELGEALVAHVGLGTLLGAGVPLAGAVLKAGAGKAIGAFKAAGGAVSKGAKKAGELLELADDGLSLADEVHLRSFGLTGAQVRKLAKTTGSKVEGMNVEAGRLKQILNRVTQEMAPDGKPIIGGGMSQSQVTSRVRAVKEQAGEAIGRAYKQIDDAIEDAPSIARQSIVDRIQKEVIDATVGDLDHSAWAAAGKKAIKNLESGGDDFTLSALHHQKGKLRQVWEGTAAQGTKSAGRKIERILADELDRTTERLSKELGFAENTYSNYVHAKKVFSDLTDLTELATSRSSQLSGNNAISLTAAIAGSAGLASGDTNLERLGLGAAGAIGTTLLKRRGWSTASALLRKTNNLHVVTKAVHSMDTAIEKAATGLTTRKVGQAATAATTSVLLNTVFDPTDTVKAKTVQEAAKHRSMEISRLAADPERMAAAVGRMTSSLATGAPGTAQAAAQVMTSAIQYLASVAPKPVPGDSQPLVDDWMPSKAEAAEFSRRVAAVVNPMSVLDSIRERRVSTEEIEALEAVYPELLQKLRTGVALKVQEMRERLSYGDLVEVSLVMGTPLDYTLKPEFVRAQQAVFATNPTEGQGGGGTRVTGLDKLNIADRLQTTSQRIEAGK